MKVETLLLWSLFSFERLAVALSWLRLIVTCIRNSSQWLLVAVVVLYSGISIVLCGGEKVVNFGEVLR